MYNYVKEWFENRKKRNEEKKKAQMLNKSETTVSPTSGFEGLVDGLIVWDHMNDDNKPKPKPPEDTSGGQLGGGGASGDWKSDVPVDSIYTPSSYSSSIGGSSVSSTIAEVVSSLTD